MLIVSRILLERLHEHGAWQPGDNEKRERGRYVLVTEDRFKDVARSVLSTARKLGLLEHVSRQDMLEVLWQWAQYSKEESEVWRLKKTANAVIFTQSLWKIRGKEDRHAEVRVYDNSVDLGLAILGKIRARGNEVKESLLAKKVLTSPRIKQGVVQACKKVVAAIEERKCTGDLVIQGDYYELHAQSWDSWSKSYGSRIPQLNIMVLHDIYGYFDKLHKWPGPWGEDADGESLKRLLFKNKSTMRHNVSTVNEDTAWASRARWHNLPVWAGPSGTTYGLCRMLRDIGGVTEEELLACAYALFAFWASAYPKTATPIHHLFGVMIAVSEFLPAAYSHHWSASALYGSLETFIRPGKL